MNARLDYDSWYLDTFIGLNQLILEKTNTELHGIVGLAYAHFKQDFKHKIGGRDEQAGVPDNNSSLLQEEIKDDLFGLRAGLSLSRKITKKFQITGDIFGGGYYRISKLDAHQTIINGLAAAPATIVPSVFASVDDHNKRFVPRFEGELQMSYKISKRWKITFSSGADVWLNMSNVRNPKPTTDILGSIDEPTNIDATDTLVEYRAGLSISFRH